MLTTELMRGEVMTLGEHIRRLRINNALSQEELAEKIGVSSQSISLWEINKTTPSLDNLIGLSELFHSTTDALLGKEVPVNDHFLCQSTTHWTESLFATSLKILYKRARSWNLALTIIWLISGIIILLFQEPEYTSIIPFSFSIIGIIRHYRIVKSVNTQVGNFMKYQPNKVTEFFYYIDHVEFFSYSDKSFSSYNMKYSDFSQATETDQYIILSFGNQYICVDKSTVQGNFDPVSVALKNNCKEYKSVTVNIVNHKILVTDKQATTAKSLLWFFFGLSILCLPLALFLISIFGGFTADTAFTENMWLLFVLLPIPLASLILGIIYKKKGLKTTKNIVAGIIIIALLSVYGSFSFIFAGAYTHDFSYVNDIESKIHFYLPDTGKITTNDWTKGTQTSSDSLYIDYMSDIQFTDKSEIAVFESKLKNSKLWMASVSTPLSSLVPVYFGSTSDYNYYMLYNVDLKNYNTIPDKSGIYTFIYLAYSSEKNRMKIDEYTLKVQL